MHTCTLYCMRISKTHLETDSIDIDEDLIGWPKNETYPGFGIFSEYRTGLIAPRSNMQCGKQTRQSVTGMPFTLRATLVCTHAPHRTLSFICLRTLGPIKQYDYFDNFVHCSITGTLELPNANGMVCIYRSFIFI